MKTKMNKFEQATNRLEERYRFENETGRFMQMVKYKEAIYRLEKSDDEKAVYRSMHTIKALKDDQPYSIEVDKEGNVLKEY